ncbi:UNVERIFIED_CONTAM: hypothetical protein DES50_101887 [Williamsia faeni]
MSLLDSLVSTGKLPLTLAFVGFLLTFIVTRVITRMIRAGRGPFRDNVSGGVHIHHAIPGIVLTIAGAFTSVGVDGQSPGAEISAVMIGIGASLVLDEFALILHLQDVYWSEQGQLSVQVVMMTGAVLGLCLLGLNPLTGESGFRPGHLVLLVFGAIHIVVLLLCVAKGKYSTAAVGAFIPPLAWIAALRIGRPQSRWARKHYGPDKIERARQRAEKFDRRFGQWGLGIEDLVAGKPTDGTSPGPTAATDGSQ